MRMAHHNNDMTVEMHMIARKARSTVAWGLFACTGLTAPSLAAGPYPDRPPTWIVGYPAGGGSDFLARKVAQQLGSQLGQPVIIENKPGASTIIAAQAAARAPADGYTLFTADNGSLILNPALHSRLSYKAGDFAPVGLMARFPLLLVTDSAGPYATAAALIDAARKNPLLIQFASPGAGGPHHMAMELLKARADFQAEHIPYKGAAPAVQDVLAGRVPAMMLDTATAQPHIQAGKLRPLAVASASRLPTYPDAPTLKELGYDVEVYAWQGLVVPAATPPAVRERLASELQKSLENPRVKAALTEFGLEVTPGTPAAMQRFIESETALWQALIRERGIRLEN